MIFRNGVRIFKGCLWGGLTLCLIVGWGVEAQVSRSNVDLLTRGMTTPSSKPLEKYEDWRLPSQVPANVQAPKATHAYVNACRASVRAVMGLSTQNFDDADKHYAHAIAILREADGKLFRQEITGLYYWRAIAFAMRNKPLDAYAQVDSIRSLVEEPSESDLWRIGLIEFLVENFLAGNSGDFATSLECQVLLIHAIDSLTQACLDLSTDFLGVEFDFGEIISSQGNESRGKFWTPVDRLENLFGDFDERLELDSLFLISDTLAFLQRMKRAEAKVLTSPESNGILAAKEATMIVQLLAFHGLEDELQGFRRRYEPFLERALPYVVADYYSMVGASLSLHGFDEEAAHCLGKALGLEGTSLDSIGIHHPLHVPILSLLTATSELSKLYYLQYWNDSLRKGDVQLLDSAWEHAQAFLRLVALRRSRAGITEDIQFLNMRAHEGFEAALQVAFAQYQVRQDSQILWQAFEVCEESKAFTLNEELRKLEKGAFDALPPAIRLQEHGFLNKIEWMTRAILQQPDGSEEISKLQARHIALKRQHEEFKARHRDAFPDYFAPEREARAFTKDSLQKCLQSLDASLVEYFVGDENVFIFLLQDGKITGIRRRSYMELVPEIDRFMDLLQSGDNQPSKFANLASSLYMTLFYPLEKKLTHSRLVTVPDVTLSRLPFDCLIRGWQAGKEDDYKRFDYLLNHYEISYAYSGQALLHALQPEKKGFDGRVHYFAPGFGPALQPTDTGCVQPALYASLQPQPQSVAFASQLQHRFVGSFHTGIQAGEHCLKSMPAHYSLVHFNTHGRNGGEGQFSGELYLARDHAGQDGILQGFEIRNLAMQADLTILSACESGAGTAYLGENRNSLGSQFCLRSRAVLQAEWRIDQVHSLKLLDSFYEGLGKGLSRSAALREAKLAFLDAAPELDQQLANPCYWAGLNLYGAPTPLSVPLIHQPNWNWWWILVVGMGFTTVVWIIKNFRRT